LDFWVGGFTSEKNVGNPLCGSKTSQDKGFVGFRSPDQLAI
jgi:hypothetical protein